jgi:RimJ/RimL family protein N-acetyltransferase
VTLPRLTGPRVVLVPTPYDVAVAAVECRDVAAPLARLGLRAGSGWPHPDTTDALRPLAEHGCPDDDGGWLVCVEGEVVGECGWRGGPDAGGDVELSYGLTRSARGLGLATEAVGVLSAWVEQQPEVRRLVAEVRVGNEASCRLLRRLCFMEEPSVPPGVRYVRTTGPAASLRFTGRHVC